MRPNVKFGVKLCFGVLCLFIYCEWFVYYLVLVQCDWPKLNPENEEKGIETTQEAPVRAMVLADTHLLGSRYGHWFDKLRREWQMHRAFQTAIKLHKPDLVFVLGDLTDEGLFCSDEEFYYYVKRFHNVFAVPKNTQMFVAVGNHDIGFHYAVTPNLNERFVQAFNSSSIQLITVRNVHFVLVNSMALEGDGCSLCRPAEIELTKIERILKCSKKKANCTDKLIKYSRPILMQHYPLYKVTDKDCNEPDEAPFPLKDDKYKEGMDCLTEAATYQLLRQLEPRLVMSGHTHHGCTSPLAYGKGIEITLPSFNWRNKDNPSYGLVVITPNNYAFFKCLMPRESNVIFSYMVGGVLLFIWMLYSLYTLSRRRKYKYH